jgi:anti-sigma B factor antagonist
VELTCSVEQLADATVVHVVGEVDLATAPKLRDVLIEVLGATPTTHLVVDLCEVGFVDSTGIGVMVGAHKRVMASGGRFSAVVTTPGVRKVLKTTGLMQAWHVAGSVEDALDGR